MREILFRGKRIDNGEWVEGCLLKVTLEGKTAHLIFGDNFSLIGGDVKALSHALVDPATVGQFTGRRFKGRKCFDGDIIFAKHSRLLVLWDDYFMMWMTYYMDEHRGRTRFCPLHDICDWEADGILGNVFDNPNLAEVMK